MVGRRAASTSRSTRPKSGYGFGDRGLGDIATVGGVSDPDDAENDLARIADRYPQVLVPAKAGDVVFFGGHVLHRSKRNFTTDRFRRSFVGHYCNARSFTQWGADAAPDDLHAATAVDPATKMTNGSHILARGDTHLPFAHPRFGTPCAALLSPEERLASAELRRSHDGRYGQRHDGRDADADPTVTDDD